MIKYEVLKRFYTDNTVNEEPIEMTPDEAREFIGGYVEFVDSIEPETVLIVNDDAMELPFNLKATQYLNPRIADILRGKVLMIKELTDEIPAN